jgi:hypothetical protein
VFPSPKAKTGYITDREVSKQWLEAKRLAGLPESIMLYCARHRFSTDAMEGSGNPMAVMDVMGHERMDTTRIYTHPGLRQVETRSRSATRGLCDNRIEISGDTSGERSREKHTGIWHGTFTASSQPRTLKSSHKNGPNNLNLTGWEMA